MDRIKYPLTDVVGYDMWEKVSKNQWLSLVVDQVRTDLGSGATNEAVRAEVARRLDRLQSRNLIPTNTLPHKSFPRHVESKEDTA